MRRATSRAVATRLMALLGAALLMSACAEQSPVVRSRPVTPSAPASGPWTPGDPTRLVGSWHLTAAGEDPGAILTIGDRESGKLVLFRRCGMFFGGWRANPHGLFIGDLYGGDQSCYLPAKNPAWPWLDRVTGFRTDGSAMLLLDRAGATVARLTPGAHPHAGPNDSTTYAGPPVVTKAIRDQVRDPAPLPAGLRPAPASDVLGRWLPVVGHEQKSPVADRAFVAFGRDGRYTGSDGCNGAGGRYVVGPDGLLLATSGASTAIGCANSPVSEWPARAGRVGLRHGRLVFVSPTGTILGEVTRA
ncbi:MAG: META domain-containing protein [Frankiales bacterium]|nr:META domain-containing protein [Frankiales bacterium]